jgi:hypothetical protein
VLQAGQRGAAAAAVRCRRGLECSARRGRRVAALPNEGRHAATQKVPNKRAIAAPTRTRTRTFAPAAQPHTRAQPKAASPIAPLRREPRSAAAARACRAMKQDVAGIYRWVIDDVLAKTKPEFVSEGVEE